MVEFHSAARQALAELERALERLSPDAAMTLADAVLRARRIVVFGLGREGLVVRAFCMRLMHLGLDAHVAGDVTTPPIGPGDALVISTGPGDLRLARAMLLLARDAGAGTIAITAQTSGMGTPLEAM